MSKYVDKLPSHIPSYVEKKENESITPSRIIALKTKIKSKILESMKSSSHLSFFKILFHCYFRYAIGYYIIVKNLLN